MWFVIREDAPEVRAMLPSTIPWKLLQGIALVQLYLEERWVEPPRLDRLPFSLLYHQTMSILASCGELSLKPWQTGYCDCNISRITQEDYKVLLRHLIQDDHIQQTEQGGLIVGLAGERVVNSFKFYGVFQENEEYTVRCEAQELGTVVMPPPVGEKLAIAGHVWTVLDIDHKRHQVYCELVKGSVPRLLWRMPRGSSYPDSCPDASGASRRPKLPIPDEKCRGPAGAGPAHRPALRCRKRASDFPWRKNVVSAALDGHLSFPDLGTGAENQMCPAAGAEKTGHCRPYYMQFTMQADADTFFRVLREELEKPIDTLELVYPKNCRCLTNTMNICRKNW